MAARQTEACERGQVPALQKADQVAAAGMQGGMSAPFRLVTHWIKEGREDFCCFMSRAMPSWAPAPACITLCAPLSKERHLGPRTFAGQQLPLSSCMPRTRAACCPKPARSHCQPLVLQKGRERTGASCLSAALHCNYSSINTTGISDVRAQCATPGSAWPRKSCHPCPRGGCAPVLAASASPGQKDAFAVPGCVQKGMDKSHRQPLILACCQTAHLGQECPSLAQGKGLPAAALCHTDNVTSRARQAGVLMPAGRTDL